MFNRKSSLFTVIVLSILLAVFAAGCDDGVKELSTPRFLRIRRGRKRKVYDLYLHLRRHDKVHNPRHQER